MYECLDIPPYEGQDDLLKCAVINMFSGNGNYYKEKQDILTKVPILCLKISRGMRSPTSIGNDMIPLTSDLRNTDTISMGSQERLT